MDNIDDNNKDLTPSQRYYRKNKDKCLARIKKHQNNNKEVYLKRTKQWQRDNNYSSHKSHLKRKHKLTPEQYNDMLVKQNYRCAICNTHQDDLPKRMSVDHNHNTNVIRELLCMACNVALGQVKDNASILSNMITYLNRHNNPL